MLLSEIQRRFYHGSQKLMKVGTMLRPQSDGYTRSEDSRATEELIEQYRPKTALSRSASVFMVDDPDLIDSAGGYDDYVYEVQPQGKIERNDLSWYSELSLYAGLNEVDEGMIRLAQMYWSGEQFQQAKHSLFEYRSQSATILRLIT